MSLGLIYKNTAHIFDEVEENSLSGISIVSGDGHCNECFFYTTWRSQ